MNASTGISDILTCRSINTVIECNASSADSNSISNFVISEPLNPQNPLAMTFDELNSFKNDLLPISEPEYESKEIQEDTMLTSASSAHTPTSVEPKETFNAQVSKIEELSLRLSALATIVDTLTESHKTICHEIQKTLINVPKQVVQLLKNKEINRINASHIPSHWYYSVFKLREVKLGDTLPPEDEDFQTFINLHASHLYTLIQACVDNTDNTPCEYIQNTMNTFWKSMKFHDYPVYMDIKQRFLSRTLDVPEYGDMECYTVTGIPDITYLYQHYPILSIVHRNPDLNFDLNKSTYRTACAQLAFYIQTEMNDLASDSLNMSHYYGIQTNGVQWSMIVYDITNGSMRSYATDIVKATFLTYDASNIIQYDKFKQILGVLCICIRQAISIIKVIERKHTLLINNLFSRKLSQSVDGDYDEYNDDGHIDSIKDEDNNDKQREEEGYDDIQSVIESPPHKRIKMASHNDSLHTQMTSTKQSTMQTHNNLNETHTQGSSSLMGPLKLTKSNLEYIHRKSLPTLYDKIQYDITRQQEREAKKPIEINIEEFIQVMEENEMIVFKTNTDEEEVDEEKNEEDEK